jgi:hypothetical protein
MTNFRVPLTSRVTPEALPSARQAVPAGLDLSLESELLTGFGGAIESAGRELGQLAQEEERKRQEGEKKRLKAQKDYKDLTDKTWARNAKTMTQDFWRKEESELLSRKGINAKGLSNEAIKRYEKMMKTVSDTAENEEQKLLYKSDIQTTRDADLNRMVSHESTETQSAAIESALDAQANAIVYAADNYQSDLSITVGKIDLNNAMDDLIALQGLDAQSAKRMKTKQLSIFHTSVLNPMIATDVERAQEYFKEHKKEISPDKREGIEKLIKKEDVLQFAQDYRDDMAIFEPDRTKWIGLAQKELEGEKEKKAVELIKDKIKSLEQKEKEEKENALLNAFNKIDAAQDLDSAKIIAEGVDDPVDRKKAIERANWRHEIKTKQPVTDRKVQAMLYAMIDSGEINKPEQLIEFEGKLKPGHYDKLITAVRNKTNKDKGAKVPEVNYTTAQRAFEFATSEKYDVEDSTHNKQFMYVLEELDALAKDKGDNLSQPEANKAAANLFVTGEVRSPLIWRFSTGTDKTFHEAAQADELDLWLPDINDESIDDGREAKDIKEALAARGIITDDETLFKLYKKEAIMNLELSDEQRQMKRRIINQIGILRPIRR